MKSTIDGTLGIHLGFFVVERRILPLCLNEIELTERQPMHQQAEDLFALCNGGTIEVFFIHIGQ